MKTKKYFIVGKPDVTYTIKQLAKKLYYSEEEILDAVEQGTVLVIDDGKEVFVDEVPQETGTLGALNDTLFGMLDRLMDEKVCSDADKTKAEIERAKAVSDISKEIISVHNTKLAGIDTMMKYNLNGGKMPREFELEKVDGTTRKLFG